MVLAVGTAVTAALSGCGLRLGKGSPASLPSASAAETARDGLARQAALISSTAGVVAQAGGGDATTTGLAEGVKQTADAQLETLGGVWQPIDLTYPDEYLSFLIEDSGAALVMCEEAVAHRFTIPRLVIDAPETVNRLSAATATPAGPSSVYGAAYILHTSGSTGRPKGVVVSHAGMAGVAQSCTAYGVTPESVVMQFIAHSFDVAMLEMGMSLLVGATLLMVPERARTLGPEFVSILRRCTHAVLTPSVAMALDTADVPSGLTLILIGEAFPAGLVEDIGHRVQLFNLYGPTETTIDATVHQVDAHDVDPVPIGHPTPGKNVAVLDEFLHPVPVGCVGELYVGGAALARG